MPEPQTTHLEYAEEAEAVERAEAWPQAAALRRRAAECFPNIPVPAGPQIGVNIGSRSRPGRTTTAAFECLRQFVEQPAMMEIVPVGATVVTWALRTG